MSLIIILIIIVIIVILTLTITPIPFEKNKNSFFILCLLCFFFFLSVSFSMGDEIELTLGLSLNGRFGTDPKTKTTNNLTRSSSSIPFSNFNCLETAVVARGVETVARVSHAPPLGRTCSLPVEAEEETRKRKEMQMLRRLEAKRKRSEKQRNYSHHGGGLRSSEERREKEVKVNSGSRSDIGCGLVGGGEEVVVGSRPPLSQASSGSSGLSELDSQTPPPPSGLNKSTEAKSPQSVQSFSEQNEHKQVHLSGTTKISGEKNEGTTVNPKVKPSRSISGTSKMVMNMLEDMPCVSTKGDGPNGKRVEGFLYRYRKGEEVRIVCVCHGSFLTPAEFIKHAGGGDVEHPLRHIVVNPSAFL